MEPDLTPLCARFARLPIHALTSTHAPTPPTPPHSLKPNSPAVCAQTNFYRYQVILNCTGQGNCVRECGGVGACVDGCTEGKRGNRDGLRHRCKFSVTIKQTVADLLKGEVNLEESGSHNAQAYQPPPKLKLKRSVRQKMNHILSKATTTNCTPNDVLGELSEQLNDATVGDIDALVKGGRDVPDYNQIKLAKQYAKRALLNPRKLAVRTAMLCCWFNVTSITN